MRFGRSRSSKVIDFGANRKLVCDFLLVRHSVRVTLVLSCTVSEILQVFVLLTTSRFHPNFGGVPVAPDLPCWSQPEQKPQSTRP